MQQPPGYSSHQAPYPPAPPAQKPKSGLPVWAIVLIVIVGLVLVFGGALAVLAFNGMNKYLAAAKSAEAKSTVGSIARAAVAAYDYETAPMEADLAPELAPGHHLCGTATPVPSTLALVRGTQYTPRSTPGVDFESGDARTGWKCLRFSVNQPIRYQYRYTQGSGYLVPSLAPGRDGFEVTAQGDLDGDGVPSTFALVGTVGSDDTVKVSPSLHVQDEAE